MRQARLLKACCHALTGYGWYHFGIGAPPILVYFSGDWDVYWGPWPSGATLRPDPRWRPGARRCPGHLPVRRAESPGLRLGTSGRRDGRMGPVSWVPARSSCVCVCVCVWVGGWVGGCVRAWVGGWVGGWVAVCVRFSSSLLQTVGSDSKLFWADCSNKTPGLREVT